MVKLVSNNQKTNFYNHLISEFELCKSFYLNVAFINFAGVQLLLNSLKSCEKRDVKGKILTSTYLNFTQPKALKTLKEFSNIDLKIFDSNLLNKGFHPKAFIFEYEDFYNIYIGSSNLTSSALKGNIEWNVKSVAKKDEAFCEEIFAEFKCLFEKSFDVNDEFLRSYESFYESKKEFEFSFKNEIKPNKMQEEALKKLEFFRQNKETKALGVASTGSGKTYLAAFDVKKVNPLKMLFIVHRENILIKAKKTFETLIKDKTFGFFTGNKKEREADFLFSTIQTLSQNFEQFSSDYFDYIVIDEAHHISSPSYEKVYEYFKPKFLLGLTATPNRSDGKSIYDYFDDNLACDIRLNDALENSLVSPFHYYGIEDVEVDFDLINLDDVSALNSVLMVNRRVDFIIEKLLFYKFSGKKRRVLGFCVSKEHAKYMSDEFNKRGLNSTYLVSSDSIENREKALKELENESSALEFIFTVDIFNEGVDIPSVNTVLMLRPTNSPIVFIQQLGRGLRKSLEKEFLTIIDFIGNHKKAFLIALALVGERRVDKESLKLSLLNNFASFFNAYIYMEEISKKRILKQIDEENFSSMKYLKERYFEFKSIVQNKIPKLEDYIFYDDIISPLPFINEKKSYVEFLSFVEDDKDLKELIKNEIFIKAIRYIESLIPLKRVYEVAILKALIEKESITLDYGFKICKKYLEVVNIESLKHSFRNLSQEFLDSGQSSRFLKLVDLENDVLTKSKKFELLCKNEKMKEIFYESLNYAILDYEKKFGVFDYGMPFLKLYEKYNMLNIANLCNFPKIHSSFRGSGFLKYQDDFFLFVTIEKDKFASSANYVNDFISNDEFLYVSKPGHSSDKGDGEKLVRNKELGVNLHIFARKFSHVDKKVQNFIYLGLGDCIEYSGNKPINTKIKLRKKLSQHIFEEFTKIIN